MTDNDIIKALDEAEWFLRNRTMDGAHLMLNEYDIGILRDISQVCARAYDEINRQKAEKEALIAGQETLQKYIAEQKAEIERLTDEREKLLKECKRCGRKTQKVIVKLQKKLKTAKAEAIKEFCEKRGVEYVETDI